MYFCTVVQQLIRLQLRAHHVVSAELLVVCVGHEKSALSRVKKLRQRISASFGRLCE